MEVPTLIKVLAARLSGDVPPWLPFRIAGYRVGRLHRTFVDLLSTWPDVFHISRDAISLAPQLRTVHERTRAVARVTNALRGLGWLPGWRAEQVAVAPCMGGAPLLYIERAAIRPFGLRLYAVHLNGLVDGARHQLWLARRAATKAIDPGLLDTVVGGGIAKNLSIRETLIKEAWEEAGIPASFIMANPVCTTLRFQRPVKQGWHDETVFIVDAFLPRGFSPVNRDNEVSEFLCLSVDEILHLLGSEECITLEAASITLDCLMRHTIIAVSEADREQLAALFSVR